MHWMPSFLQSATGIRHYVQLSLRLPPPTHTVVPAGRAGRRMLFNYIPSPVPPERGLAPPLGESEMGLWPEAPRGCYCCRCWGEGHYLAWTRRPEISQSWKVLVVLHRYAVVNHHVPPSLEPLRDALPPLWLLAASQGRLGRLRLHAIIPASGPAQRRDRPAKS